MNCIAKSGFPVVIVFALIMFAGPMVGSSYGTLIDTFDPPNPAVTSEQVGSAPGPVVFPDGPTGSFLRLVNDNVNSQSNHYAYDLTDAGVFAQVDGAFDFRISSEDPSPADGFSVIFLPTTIYGNTGTGASGEVVAEEPSLSQVFALGFDIYPHGTTNEVSAHWDGALVANADLPLTSIDLVAGVFHHVDFSLAYVDGGANLNVSLTPDVHGAPGATVAAFTDLFIAGISPYEYRVQLSARTGGLNASMDIDNINIEAIPEPATLLLLGLGGLMLGKRR